MSEQELLSLPIHDWGMADNFTGVLRVYKGWIYYRWDEEKQDYHPQGTFVPERSSI